MIEYGTQKQKTNRCDDLGWVTRTLRFGKRLLLSTPYFFTQLSFRWKWQKPVAFFMAFCKELSLEIEES